jgi:hypothetical protein
MTVNGIVYLVNKSIRKILYAGDVPPTYGNITGLAKVDYSTLRDLAAKFGPAYANLGFLTEKDALLLGIPQAEIDRSKAAAWELKWNGLEEQRSELIQAQRWRIDRYNDEVAMGHSTTEDVLPVLKYCQAIRDLPDINPDPFNIVWPVVPLLPAA